MSDQPSSYPTSSDISMFMRELGFNWSNDAQIYYHDDMRGYEHLSNKTAERLYKYLIGEKAYTPYVSEKNKANGINFLRQFIEESPRKIFTKEEIIKAIEAFGGKLLSDEQEKEIAEYMKGCFDTEQEYAIGFELKADVYERAKPMDIKFKIRKDNIMARFNLEASKFLEYLRYKYEKELNQ